MSKLYKLYERIKNNPKTVRFEELDKILIKAGYKKRQPRNGSSHYTYTKGDKRLTVPYNRPYILQAYIEMAIELLEGDDDFE